MSESKQEELFMSLSIIIALISYKIGLTWLVYIFGAKAIIEVVAVFYLAFKEIKKDLDK